MPDGTFSPPLPGDEGYFRTLFHAVPCPVVIVDFDVRIVEYNTAAEEMLGPDRKRQYTRRGGDALKCIDAVTSPGGCGTSEHCADCILRNAVGEVKRGGKTHRGKTKMRFRDGEGSPDTEVEFLVTAAPLVYEGKPLVLLILEDISELMQLRRILPICSHCKKIRNDRNYWESVEGYLLKHTDLEFTHSICENCLKEHYREFSP